jgi:hypothetical protein
VLAVTVAGTTGGSDLGQLTVSGAMTIAGTLDITTPGSFTPTSGELFTIVSYASETGSFSSVRTTGTATYGPPQIDSTEIQLEAT